MTIRKRIDTSPSALPKAVAALRRDFEQEKASLGLRRSTIQVGGEVLVTRDGVLNFVDTTGAERPVVPTSSQPFPNADFEEVAAQGFPSNWTAGAYSNWDPVAYGTDPTVSLTGDRSLEVSIPAGGSGTRGGVLDGESWLVPEGSAVSVTAYFKRTSTNQSFGLGIITNTADGVAAAGAPGAIVTLSSGSSATSLDWSAYTATLTMPAGHTRVSVRLVTLSTGTAAGSMWVDSVSAVATFSNHDDFMRRAQAVMGLSNAGSRGTDSAGNIYWSDTFVIAGAGRQSDEASAGGYYVWMPTNGTVIPVHGSNSRTSYTVTSGKVLLAPGEALWYRLGFGTSNGEFRILSYSVDFSVDQGWVLICAYHDPSLNSPVFKWGDGRTESPETAVTNGTNVNAASVTASTRNGVAYVNVNCTASAILAAGATLFTLPPFARPQDFRFGDLTSTGDNPYRVHVDVDGTVKVQSAVASGVTLRGQLVYPL